MERLAAHRHLGGLDILALHGLMHLLGFVAYWPLGTIKGIAYKTSLLGAAWEVGAAGIVHLAFRCPRPTPFLGVDFVSALPLKELSGLPAAATFAARVVLALHGLVHLMRFVAYWPLANVKGIPYKTSLLGQAWVLSPAGMRIYSVGWLAVGLGFMVAVGALAMRFAWARPFLVAVTLVSLVATVLGWPGAVIGTVIDLAILAAIYFRLL